jgi:hypothetical protein
MNCKLIADRSQSTAILRAKGRFISIALIKELVIPAA